MLKNRQFQKKNTQYKARTAIFLGLALLYIGLFLPLISSFEFDNYGDYDQTTKTITIKNGLTFGEEIAEIKLNTPLIYEVIRGEDRLVAEIKINSYEDYRNALKNMEFYDGHTGEPITRPIKYKEKIIEIQNYTYAIAECETLDPKTCVNEQHNATRELITWKEINPKSILDQGEVTIGIFTTVYPNDYVEWIPTFYGVKITQWALFTENLQFNLKHHWTFEGHPYDYFGTSNMTDQGSTSYTLNGIQNMSVGTMSDGNYLRWTDGDVDAVIMSYNFWANFTSEPSTTKRYWSHDTGGQYLWMERTNATGVLLTQHCGSYITCYSNFNANEGEWNMLTVTADDNDWIVYINGSQTCTMAMCGDTYGSYLNLGIAEDGSGYPLNAGYIDEFSYFNETLNATKVVDLYNNGLGLDLFEVSNVIVDLDFPTNGYSAVDSSLNFNATHSTTETTLVNTTLTLWYGNGSVFNTNFTTITGSTNYTNLSLTDITIGNFTWNYYTCAENASGFAICNNSVSDYTYNRIAFTENSYTYNTTSIETSQESFILNISVDDGVIPTDATFYYNDSSSTATITSQGSNVYLISADVTVPEITPIQLNFTTFFNLYIEGNYYNSSEYNQTVNQIPGIIINKTACNPGYFEAINYTFQDETNRSYFTDMDIAYNYEYGVGNYSSKEVYGDFDSVGSFRLCINATINSYNLGYGEVEYTRDSYTTRKFYHYYGQNLSNTTTIEVDLYDLFNSDATSFLFEFKDTSLTPFTENYASILRWYPELDLYKVVEMGKTDDKGQTIMRVKIEDTDYRVGLYELDGTLIKLLNPVRFACLSSPCTYTSLIDLEETDYTSFFQVDIDLDYNNNTGLWTLVWNDPSYNTDNITLLVTRETATSSAIICNTSSSGYTGVLNCDSSAYSGTLRAVVYRSASPAIIIAEKIVNTARTVFKSPIGLFFSVVIFIALVLIGILSPVLSIILGIVALVPAYFIGSINLPILIGIAVLGGIVVHFLKRSS